MYVQEEINKMPTCQVCQGEQFTIDAGFSYCDDCGTQAQNFQEVEYEAFFEEDYKLNKSNIKVAAEDNELKLTSYEEFNYILIGLVNELINLGAKKELKLTALQLWTSYLRINEVAFFSRKSTKIPKLSASFRKKDAEIIYNLKTEKRKRSRSKRAASSTVASSQTGSGGVAERRAYRKTQRNLASAEYGAYQSEQETNTSMSVMIRSTDDEGSTSAMSSRTSASSAPITIEFSRMARRLLKKSMPKKHLHKHEVDGQLPCHKFLRKNIRRTYHPEVVSRHTMYELLYLALNQIDDDIQLGDMLRFIKEGHLTFSDVIKFFPSDMRPAQRAELLFTFNRASITHPSHSYLRYGSRQLAALLGVRMRLPNMIALTARYVADLALPEAVHKVIETLLTICPPKMRMQTRGKQQMPLYEGRAVAYVLFAMKLMFCLDDCHEERMSVCAQRINERLRRQPGDRRQKPLFVLTEWMHYVEMRNVILTKCHHGTAIAQQPNASAENAHLYAAYLRTYHDHADLPDVDYTINHRKHDRENMTNAGIICAKAGLLEENWDRKIGPDRPEVKRTSLKFQPTLQPKSSYMEHLLEDTVMASTVHIPAYMYVQHTGRDVVPFLQPGELRRRMVGHRLNVVRLSSLNRFGIIPPFRSSWPDQLSAATNPHATLRRFYYDIGVEDWLKICKAKAWEANEISAARAILLQKAVSDNVQQTKDIVRAYTVNARRATARQVHLSKQSPTRSENESVDLFSQLPESDEIPAGQRMSEIAEKLPTNQRSRESTSPGPEKGVDEADARAEDGTSSVYSLQSTNLVRRIDNAVAVSVGSPSQQSSRSSSRDSRSSDRKKIGDNDADAASVSSRSQRSIDRKSSAVDSQSRASTRDSRSSVISSRSQHSNDRRSPTERQSHHSLSPDPNSVVENDAACLPKKQPTDFEQKPIEIEPSQWRETDAPRVPLLDMVLSSDNESEDDEDDDTEPLDFCVSDFDYWMCSGRLDDMRFDVFRELSHCLLPRNFTWLLRQCAQLIECNERDVYRELLTIENFYAYRLAPFEQMRNMLLYRSERREMHLPGLSIELRRFLPYW